MLNRESFWGCTHGNKSVFFLFTDQAFAYAKKHKIELKLHFKSGHIESDAKQKLKTGKVDHIPAEQVLISAHLCKLS